MNGTSYSREEREAIAEAWRNRRTPSCPRCAVPLSTESVPDPKVVSYVRHRSWLRCPSCSGATVADDPRDGAS